ncbi:MAG: precorrin-6A/cobalt-precorrin-6A reductase, partial [Atopobiaceae bacterium]|nr:precorrin-6A/cobalt-precorrin-6A reductase [Atopobiaceae bacterium]
KQSGKAGGFDEKIAAAAALRVKVIALRRPEEPDGVTLEEAKELLEDQYGL